MLEFGQHAPRRCQGSVYPVNKHIVGESAPQELMSCVKWEIVVYTQIHIEKEKKHEKLIQLQSSK